MERMFPRRIEPGARLPYGEYRSVITSKYGYQITYRLSISTDTIWDAVRRAATGLSRNLPTGTKINVWFTGHSLGTALASLVYARAINEPHDFGEDVVLRDAYLFATPVIADVQSVRAFHNRLNHDPRRMMWRVTNGLDPVATALPDAGDNTSIPLGEYNLFSFAHLGIELKLREAPQKGVVCGNAFAHETTVRIESEVTNLPTHPRGSMLRTNRRSRSCMTGRASRFWAVCCHMHLRFIGICCKTSSSESASGRIRPEAIWFELVDRTVLRMIVEFQYADYDTLHSAFRSTLR